MATLLHLDSSPFPGDASSSRAVTAAFRRTCLADALGSDVNFIVPELTTAVHNPAMSEVIPLFEASRQRALDDTTSTAKAIAHLIAA